MATVHVRIWARMRRWWTSRNPRLLLAGLPVLLVALAVLLLMLLGVFPARHEMLARYQQRAHEALAARDYATALTCYDRLAAQGGGRPEFLFGLAQCAEALQQTERAQSILRELAPADRQGFGPAHLWWARLHLRSFASPTARKHAEIHLLRALEGGVDDRVVVHGLLGELYLADSRLELAETHLAKAVRQRPQLRLRLAFLYAMRGDQNRARSEAQLAVNAFKVRTQANLHDDTARLTWADGVTFLEDFPEAVRILEEGLTLTGNAVYRQALGRVYATWVVVAEKKSAAPATMLELVEKGLRYDPSNQALLDRLLAALRPGGQHAARARAALYELLAAGGEAAGTIHFVLGVDALQNNQPAEARVHWERALELAPHLPVVANNLAWSLANTEPPDLARALTLANLAIEKMPHNANYRDTRGQILMKMRRWQEALTDLEAALPGMPNSSQLHISLARVYEQLGVPAMAAEHRRLADKKRAAGKAG